MAGNVLEWVEECCHESSAGAPADGLAWIAESAAAAPFAALSGSTFRAAPRRDAQRNTPDVRRSMSDQDRKALSLRPLFNICNRAMAPAPTTPPLARWAAKVSRLRLFANVGAFGQGRHHPYAGALPTQVDYEMGRAVTGKRSRVDVCRISISESRCPLFREIL
jgi:hypothetical protein